MSEFTARMDQLAAEVGDGDLVIRTVFDQVYAKYQELREDLQHPRGGQAHYVRDGLLVRSSDWLGQLARGLITPEGSRIRETAAQVADDLAYHQESLAPVEFVNLRRSGHPIVTDDGAVTHDRAPDVPRLSEAQLRAQRKHGHDLDYGAYSARPR